MLANLIKETAVDFGLVDIIEFDMLNNIRQTSFSFTTSPQSLCLAVNKKYYQQAYTNPCVVAIIAPPSAVLNTTPGKSVVIVQKAAEFFYFLHNTALHRIVGMSEKTVKRSIAESAMIAETAIVGDHIAIGENVFIDHHCIIMDNTVIGEGTVIGPKGVIGVAGFFSKSIRGRKEHLHHYGGVQIGRNCKLHSDITLSRSVNFGEYTQVGDSVHIGHKSVIGHDCKIGRGTDISVMALIAGRVTIGDNCWIGANASISNACTVGSGSAIRIGSVVISNVPENSEVSGNFATDHKRRLSRFIKER
jgi:acyl-[acyl carrier protein]--UDP-N-acetylglucosamine O-acyltransferase